MRKPRRNALAQLVTQARMRNELLTVATIRQEVRIAAERVRRLSNPGTPERLMTLIAVEAETGLRSTAIVDELVRLRQEEQE